jgi:hypothetical protein
MVSPPYSVEARTPATRPHPTLAGEPLDLANVSRAVTSPDAVVRADGVIHGIDHLLVPRSVQEKFNCRRSLASISAALLMGAPEVDPCTYRLLRKPGPGPDPRALLGAPPELPVWDSIAPTPALGLGSRTRRFDG